MVISHVTSNVISYVTWLLLAVGSLNNNRSVMSKSYAWRPLALLPILKASACTNQSADFLRYRRLDLYHASMGFAIGAVNILCDRVLYLCYGDNKVLETQAFLHLFSMDGLKVYMSTMADTRQCPSCAAPHNMLDSTEHSFPNRDMVIVQETVKKAQEKLLDEHKQIKDRCKQQVM